ncbi:MAG: PDZ domain-containing protein, partial [Planctomycetes bacterium]|nr:PDZ domain-containing protein [Planctomycetota bacterium]
AYRPGLVIDDAGHVLVGDAGLEDRFIERIEVQAGGKTYPAQRGKLLYDAPAVVLDVRGAAGQLEPVRFVPLADRGIETSLFASSLRQVDDEWHLRFEPIRPSVRLVPAGDGNVYFGSQRPAMGISPYATRYVTFTAPLYLVADASGRPVGCATTSFFDLHQDQCRWKGPDLLKAKAIAWKDLRGRAQAVRSRLVRAVQEVVLVLRSAGEERGYSGGSGGAPGREVSAYGLAISATEVAVLRRIDSRTAKNIEKIYIKESSGGRLAAEFVGAWREVGGFVVRLAKGKLPAWVVPAGQDPPRMRPFWTARLRKRLGQKYVDLSTNRLYGKRQGYKGKYHWYAARSIAPGTFLVDFDGRIVGAYAYERPEHEEESSLEAAQGYSYRSAAGSYRVFVISELRDMLARPVAHMDPKIKVRPRTLARRRAWLGVEFVPVSSKLAEMLKVETPTKDGQLGFLVNAVYADSPAERMKLKVGDILLKLQAPGLPYPIELAARYARSRYGYSGRWYSPLATEGEAGPVRPTWKKRNNFLTQALDAIGVGRTVKLTYYRPGEPGKTAGKTFNVDYRIELAPPDQDSAAKWKNRKLGLTVKDVTYEVRHALNLRPPAGVLVTNVESGSPTDVAKIFPNEVITRMDDRPIASARQMRDMVAGAAEAGRHKVRLTILRLGRTRFADLDISGYDPADDEGIDQQRP